MTPAPHSQWSASPFRHSPTRARGRTARTLVAMWAMVVPVVTVAGTASVAALAMSVASAPAASAATVTCTPDSGFTNCVRVTYSGANQSWTVPAGVEAVKIQAWGAGGGGLDSSHWSGGATGASGGYSEGIQPVKAGDVFAVVVGGGGIIKSTTSTYGGGGAGGPGGSNSIGSSGGG